MAERGAVFLVERTLGGTVVEGQLMPVAVERTLERLGIVNANHRRNTDVSGQFYVVATEADTIIDFLSEFIPIIRVGNDVRIGLGTCAFEIVNEDNVEGL